jgi:glutamate 5-kinase
VQDGRFDEAHVAHIADQVQQVQHGCFGKVALVVSGSVAAAEPLINGDRSADRMRAVAGIGQVILIRTLDRIFNNRGVKIAFIPVTPYEDRIAFAEEIERVVQLYFKSAIVPIFNENDVVSLNCFGGKDILTVRVAELLRANRVLMLSHKNGSKHGVGGRESKERAISLLQAKGTEVRVVDGGQKGIIVRSIFEGRKR